MEIDRRHILLGSGLAALTLAGCRQGQGNGDRPESDGGVGRGNVRMVTFEPQWNLGDPPWDNPPAGTPPFSANYICVLHLEVQADPLRLVGRRAHFPTEPSSTPDLAGITPRVVEVINYMNAHAASTAPDPLPSPLPSPTPCPSGSERPCYLEPYNDIAGLAGFGFTRPHHIVIYIKNREADFDPKFPIWFGGMLIGNHTRAHANRSFFNAKPDTLSGIATWSDRIVYVRNHFTTADTPEDGSPNPRNRGPIRSGPHPYSMNINAIIKSTDSTSIDIPLIIDPDTGNMGGGGGASRP